MRIVDTRAVQRSQDRYLDGGVRGAFDSLDLGVTFDDVVDYLEGAGAVERLRESPLPAYASRARLVGLVAAAMIVAVELERDRFKRDSFDVRD